MTFYKVFPMRKAFQFRLLFCCVAVFTVAFGALYVFQTNVAEKNALNLMSRFIDDVARQQKDIKEKRYRTIRDMQNNLLENANMLVLALRYRPDLADDKAFFKEWVFKNGLAQANLVDENGVVTMSNVDKNIGFNFQKNRQEYLILQNGAQKEYVEDLKCRYDMKDDCENQTQFVGVSRQDSLGFVQTGASVRQYRQNFPPDVSIADYLIGKNGEVLIANDGYISFAKDESLIDKSVDATGIPSTLLKGKSGFFKTSVKGKESFVYYVQSGNDTIIALYPVRKAYEERNAVLFYGALWFFVLSGVFFAVVSFLLEKNIVQGVRRTNAVFEKIANGQWDEKLQESDNEEFILLSENVNAVVDTLKQTTKQVQTYEEKERDLIFKLQKSFLPSVFPAYPNQNEFDIHALMMSSKNVGGTFYDFFLTGEKEKCLGMLIVDVADKKISSILSMISAKTWIKSFVESGMNPAEAFINTNKKLCENNTDGTSVSAFFVLLEIQTGKLICVNAGHTPPFLKCGDKSFNETIFDEGLKLGLQEDFVYTQQETFLNGNDALFLYSDSLTRLKENYSPSDDSDYLKELFNETDGKTACELSECVQKSVTNLCDEKELVDDVAVLTLIYNKKSVTVPAKVEKQDEVMLFVNQELKTHKALPKTIAQADIALEEIFVGLCRSPYMTEQTIITVDCSIGGMPEFLTLTFKNQGKSFNPLQKQNSDVLTDEQEREVENTSIFMVTKIMDFVDYEYRNDENILNVRKTLETEQSETNETSDNEESNEENEQNEEIITENKEEAFIEEIKENTDEEIPSENEE